MLRWTAEQSFADVAVSGGTIDGTSIGGVAPASGSFTTLQSTGATLLGDGNDNVTVSVGTGELTLQGIDADPAGTALLTINGSNQVRTTPVSSLSSTLSGTIAVSTNATLSGNGTAGSPLGINLANANVWSGGQTFGLLATTGTTTLGDGNDNVTVNVGAGELTLQGIDVDAAATTLLTVNASG